MKELPYFHGLSRIKNAPIMKDVLLVASLIGYVVAAAVFYALSAKSAMQVDDQRPTMPARVALTVVEGGQRTVDDVRRAA